MEHRIITAVGIDVSKHKSMVAVRRPGGEVVMEPFEVQHTAAGIAGLVSKLSAVDGEVRVVMEHTGMYWRPVAMALKQAGFFVSVVNAILIHRFSDNSLRKVKTDKADAMKIANYALAYWSDLRDYSETDETRQLLKVQCRLYERTIKTAKSLRNSLISILDQTFPGANNFFPTSTTTRKATTSGWILCGVSGIKTTWRQFPSNRSLNPSASGAREQDTTTARQMPREYIGTPGNPSPRSRRTIAQSC